jgi:hypothetical protein
MKDFVSYKIAVKLKEKGFKEECLARYWCDKAYFERNSYNTDTESVFYCYNNDEEYNLFYIDAPTIEQVLKWLRNNKKTMTSILPVAFNEKENKFNQYYYTIYYATEEFVFEMHERPYTFETYEECALEAIEYAIDKLI